MASEQMPRGENNNSEKEREVVSDRAKSWNIAKDKEEGRESGGGVHHVSKLETKGDEKKKGLREKAELERRTREVEGREWSKKMEQRSRPRGKVEAEKARPMEKPREETKGRENSETKEGGGEERGGRKEEKGEENKQSTLEDISKHRAEAQQKAMSAIEGAKERYEREKQAASEASKERNLKANEESIQAKDKMAEERTRVVVGREWNKEKSRLRNSPRGKVEAEKARPLEKTKEEDKGREKAETKEGGNDEEHGRGREENEQPSLEEISKNIAEAQKNAIEGANERYEREKQAESEASKERNLKANEEATQAKDKMAEERTREVVGREWNKEDKQRNSPRGKVEAEKARPLEKTKEEAKETKEGGDEEYVRGREETGEENKQPSLEEISKYRAEAQQKAMNAIEGAKERYEREKLAANEASKEINLKENEEEPQEKDKKAETKESGAEEQRREEKEQPSLEEISKYRGEAQQKSINAIEDAKERYEREKQAATEASSKERNMHANEEATQQAKDVTRDKGQQGNPEAEDEKGYGATKDTIGTVHHTTALAEKAKAAGDTASQCVGDKATQAKDATLETGKSAAKVVEDLKDKAVVAGSSVAHYSAEMTLEGINVVKEAAEFAAEKVSELAAMSVDTAKGLVAAAGENAKEYAERDLEATREAQNQESEEMPSAKTTNESFQRGQGQQEHDQEGKREHGSVGRTVDKFPQRTTKPHESNIFEGNQGEGVGDTISTGESERKEKALGDIIGEGFQGKGGDVKTSIGEKLGSAAQTIKKPLDKATEGGREVLGAVGETVVEIGENMVKPAQKVQHQGEGVLNAIGETIAEIAETTRVIVAGEGEKEAHEYDSGKHGNLKLD